MDDKACVEFLQWALPSLRMRWAGFRKVRGQVCKRIGRRVQLLQLQDAAAYKDYLQRHDEEWEALDSLCRITITRFLRDRRVFASLQRVYFPEVLHNIIQRGETALRIWSIGCAAGEEPYSLAILWDRFLGRHLEYGNITLEIAATDSDQRMLDRAMAGCYPHSSIKNLPEDWRLHTFIERDSQYCLQGHFKKSVHFLCQDVRVETPPGQFDLVLCRNLIFTYFDETVQKQVLQRLEKALQPQGLLVIGIHERLPQDYERLSARSLQLGVYQRPKVDSLAKI